MLKAAVAGDDGGGARERHRGAGHIVEDVAEAYEALPPQAKASMLEDLERGRRLELPWLSGAVVAHRQGASASPTPIHRFIPTVLKPYVNGSASECLACVPSSPSVAS